jgi:hypothetical protein
MRPGDIVRTPAGAFSDQIPSALRQSLFGVCEIRQIR